MITSTATDTQSVKTTKTNTLEEIDLQLLTQLNELEPGANGTTKEVSELKLIALDDSEITFNRSKKRRSDSSIIETSKFKTEVAFNSGTCSPAGYAWKFLKSIVAGD